MIHPVSSLDHEMCARTIMSLKGTICGLEAELCACKADSEVLSRIVGVVNDDKVMPFRVVPDLNNTPPIDDDENLKKLQSKAAECDRLRNIVGTMDDELEELSMLYCARCDQLEKIELVVAEYAKMNPLIDVIDGIIKEN